MSFLSINSTYNQYLDKSVEPVSREKYKQINYLYNKFLIGKVLDGDEVYLPQKLGTLSIVGTKQKVSTREDGTIVGLAPDWVKTKRLWESNPKAKEEKKLMYHTNSNTDGVRYKFFWCKSRVLIENKTLYSLRLTRENKRSVHKKILEGKEYIVR